MTTVLLFDAVGLAITTCKQQLLHTFTKGSIQGTGQ